MKVTLGRQIFVAANTLLLVFLTLITLYPIWHVIVASMSESDLLMAHRGALLAPLGLNLTSYVKVFKDEMVVKGYLNTLFVVGMSLVFNMILTSFAAYFLTRKGVYTKNFVMGFIIFTMYFSGGTIPFYFTVKDLGLLNSLWALILPTAINTYNVIVLRSGFLAVPESLYEAARIDGAGHFRILFGIYIPLAKATVAVVILYYLIGHWNAWFNASIFINEETKKPLQLVLRTILIQNDNASMTEGVINDQAQAIGESIKYAVIVVSTLPVMCIYPFLQKYFAKGAIIGAVKE